ncbi:uncharacterized protein [Amphiura filiformis]|uniref:uncharacterized protein n=1 Tax=Amphiura filiformis TaxID=82378 RepID=UPI003B21A805
MAASDQRDDQEGGLLRLKNWILGRAKPVECKPPEQEQEVSVPSDPDDPDPLYLPPQPHARREDMKNWILGRAKPVECKPPEQEQVVSASSDPYPLYPPPQPQAQRKDIVSHFTELLVASSNTDSISWSSIKYPMKDMISKFSLPIFAMIANTYSFDGASVNQMAYRLKRMETIETITAHSLPFDGLDGESIRQNRETFLVSIPKGYTGLFKVLPFEDRMRDKEVTYQEILAYRPSKIKVVDRGQRTPVLTKLDHGCELEVLGTKVVASASGEREILRLQNSTCSLFTLHPDCGGKFQVVEDDTEYTLTEIVTRFPLPQKVALVRTEKHSDNLLDMLELASSKESKLMHLLLEKDSHDEYIIGEDSNKENGIVANVDADVKFHIHNSFELVPKPVEYVPPAAITLVERDDHEVLRPENLIYKGNAKPVVCKPLVQLFHVSINPSDLPQRQQPERDETVSHSTEQLIAASDTEEGASFRPHESTETDEGASFQPHERTDTDKGASFQPHERTDTDKGASFQPHERTDTDEGASFQPHERTDTDEGASFQPHKRTDTDEGASFQPHERTDTDEGAYFQPHERTDTDEGASFQPHERTDASEEYPLKDLTSKFSLPIYATIANTSNSEGSTGNQIVYHLKHVETIQTIVAYKLLPSDGESIILPKAYRGPWKVLPFEDHMCDEVTFAEMLAYTPRKIKVVGKVQRAPAWINLDHGCELEVMGTKVVASTSGPIEILRLQNSMCPFSLHPDCGGKFQVVEDDTEYTLTEIVERFPLPQKVALVRPEKHSDNLLELASPKESKLMHLLLKRESYEEYIIGEDTSKQNGIVANVDADVSFHIPRTIELVPKSEVELEPRSATSIRMKRGDNEVGIIRRENLIYKGRNKPVVCKPVEQLFNVSIGSLDLHRRPRRRTISEPSRKDSKENTPVRNRALLRRLDRSTSVPTAECTIGLPSSQPEGMTTLLTTDEIKGSGAKEENKTEGVYEVRITRSNEENEKRNEIKEESENEYMDEFIKENEYAGTEYEKSTMNAGGEDGAKYVPIDDDSPKSYGEFTMENEYEEVT